MSTAQRRWKRFKVDIRLRLRRWEEPEDAALVVRSYELSQGGLSVYTPQALEIGTTVMVAFALAPEEKTLRLQAVVRSARGFRYGLEFVEPGADERAAIAGYLGTLAGAAEA